MDCLEQRAVEHSLLVLAQRADRFGQEIRPLRSALRCRAATCGEAHGQRAAVVECTALFDQTFGFERAHRVAGGRGGQRRFTGDFAKAHRAFTLHQQDQDFALSRRETRAFSPLPSLAPHRRAQSQ